MTVATALAILARYHRKVNHPEYLIRKRGNPESVVKAMTLLNGSTACVQCGRTERTELNHIDGNWRNYTVNNLRFYCKPCHITHHKLLRMHMRETVFTNEMHQEIRNLVDAGVAAGRTKNEMFEEVAKRYNIHPQTLQKRYYMTPDQMREAGRRYGKTKRTSSSFMSNAVTSTPTGMPTGVQILPVSQALGLLQGATQFGFSGNVSISFHR